MATKNKTNIIMSFTTAFIFALVAHIQVSRAYAKAFLLEKTSYIPREPLMLLLGFAIVFALVYLVRTYKSKAFWAIMSVFLIAVLALRMEGKAYLEWLGYRNISVGLVSKECSVLYDPGVNFNAIDPYTNLPIKGFACWSDFTTWQSSYYTS